MNLYFQGLIEENSETVMIEKDAPGSFVKGKWVDGTTTNYNIDVLVTKPKPAELEKYDGGIYVSNSKKVRSKAVLVGRELLEDLSDETGTTQLIEIHYGDIIIINGKRYHVIEVDDNTIHADFKTYILKKEVDDAND